MYIRKFTYSAEDVNCRNCTEYAAKLGCRHEVCPFLTERIEAGVVSYQSAVKAMIPRRSILWNRLSALIQNYPDYLWADSNHKTRMELFNHQLGYNKSRNTPSYYAAMYLLTSNQGLFNRTGNCFYRSGIEFGYATLNGISAHDILPAMLRSMESWNSTGHLTKPTPPAKKLLKQQSGSITMETRWTVRQRHR